MPLTIALAHSYPYNLTNQDDVPPFPDEVAFAIIESQLGRPLGELFSSISERPVAAASLGQVGARLHALLLRRSVQWCGNSSDHSSLTPTPL